MDDIELIKERINIVDLIQEYLPLKKSGVNFKANCPFHQEKTASFVVSPERNIWHCFGCSRGGDHFKFLMEKEGIDFPEALETLAKRAGVTLKRYHSEGSDQKKRLLEVNLKACQFFHFILTEHPLGKKALTYLKQRCVSEEMIKLFKLGYAPNSWDSLNSFLKKRGFTTEEIVQSGLAVPLQRSYQLSQGKGSHIYDRFRGRVMFPVINQKEEIVGFSGRILSQGEPASTSGLGGPKYLNTPQTLLFDKSHLLFGLNLAKAEARSKKQIILVEGLMDMLMSYQAGALNTVAVQGTALTEQQVDLIKKYAEEVLLSFDQDLAGDSASRRSIEMLEKVGLGIKIIEISGGKDPAEIVTQNAEDWLTAIDKAVPIYDYYLRSVSLRFPTSTADGRKKIAAELIPIWAKINETMTAEYYLQKLAALLSVSEDVLRREIQKYSRQSTTQNYEAVLTQLASKTLLNLPNRRHLLEEYLLALLLKIPTILTFVPNFPETIFLSDDYRSIYVMLVLYLDAISYRAKAFNISEFVKSLPPDLMTTADQLYLIEIDQKLESARLWQEEVEEVVAALKKALVKASLEKLSGEIKNAQLFGKMELLETLNRRFRDLSIKLKNL